MIDVLVVWCEELAHVGGLQRRDHEGDGTRRDRGMRAALDVRNQLGRPLVHANDRVVQAVGGEDLRSAKEAALVDLEELDRFGLVRADVVAAARVSARPYAPPIENQTLAER